MGTLRGLRLRPALIVVSALGAFALSALAGESRRTLDMSRAFDAGALPDFAVTRTPPDPPPLVAQKQWVFDLRWDRGAPWLLGVRAIELPAPQTTPRVMGRFALELFEGPTLIERVRFDFPLLADSEVEGPIDGGVHALSLSAKLRTRVGVVFPSTSRGTRLELWDRATNRRWSLPWPATSTR